MLIKRTNDDGERWERRLLLLASALGQLGAGLPPVSLVSSCHA